MKDWRYKKHTFSPKLRSSYRFGQGNRRRCTEIVRYATVEFKQSTALWKSQFCSFSLMTDLFLLFIYLFFEKEARVQRKSTQSICTVLTVQKYFQQRFLACPYSHLQFYQETWTRVKEPFDYPWIYSLKGKMVAAIELCVLLSEFYLSAKSRRAPGGPKITFHSGYLKIFKRQLPPPTLFFPLFFSY